MMTLHENTSLSLLTPPHTSEYKKVGFVVDNNCLQLGEETSLDVCEANINDFLESEAVRTVMLADYLKALGIY